MKFRIHLFYIAAIAVITLSFPRTALSEPEIKATLGGGYSNNLYADSFGLGNSYLYNTVRLSSTHFKKTRIGFFYEIAYYEYDTNNLINNFLHSPGLTVYRAARDSRFRWNLTARGFIKQYTDELSTYDNNRFRFDLNTSFYLKPGLQVKGAYQGEISSYADYSVLQYSKHFFEIGTAKTFPSRTTLDFGVARTFRDFEEGDAVYGWTDIGVTVAQSIDIRTGLSLSYLERLSSDGSRPLSTFYIISGVSAYWDSWEGRQAKLGLKRILPLAVLSNLEFFWWDRKFSYDQEISDQLPWLAGKSSRNDNGYAFDASLRRQFNLKPGYGKYIAVSLSGGYSENRSDDDYYSYNNYFIDCGLEYSVF
jgi:hypothetical protein